MKQHVSRRRRCWTPLVQMDPVIHLSEGHRSDMLLDLCGLTREERVVVQALITNERDFDRVAKALIIQHPRIHFREGQKRARGKGKDGFKRGDNSSVHLLRGKGKGKHVGSGNSGKSGTSAHHASYTPVEDCDYVDDAIEFADAKAHSDPFDFGSDDGEEFLHDDDDEENETFSSYVALDDVTVLAAAELDAVALLADTWDYDLDPEVSAQRVQASAQAYLSFGKEKGKEKNKGKGKGKGQISCSFIIFVTGGSSTKTERTESENRVSCLRSKGTLGSRSRMCNVSFQFAYTKLDTYSSNDDTTTTLHQSEEGRNVLCSQ